MSISRNQARDLSALGSRIGATVLGGELIRLEDRFFINKTDVTGLLANLVGQNVVIIANAVSPATETETKTCLTCGRDYTEAECPHCVRVRSRLRGRNNR